MKAALPTIAAIGVVLAAAIAGSALTARGAPVLARGAVQEAPRSSDFDFLIGTWEMTWLRLQGGEWVRAGVGISSVRSSADGHIIVDEWEGDGVTLRTYDPETGRWRLFWTDRGPFRGDIQYWEGRFEDSVGTFVGGDRLPQSTGKVTSKIVFSAVTDSSLRWELSRSADDGRTWLHTDTRLYRRLP